MNEFVGNALDVIGMIGENTSIGAHAGDLNRAKAVFDIADEYKENLEETKSHVDSMMMTGVKTGVDIAVGDACVVGSLAIGTEIATLGGYHPVSIGAGVIVGAGTLIACTESTKKAGDLAKQAVRQVNNGIRKLPDLARKVIRKCIGPSVAQSVSKSNNGTETNSGSGTGTISPQGVDKVTNVMSDVIFDNWEKIAEKGAIIYFEDVEKKRVQIEVSDPVVKKIVSYCEKMAEQEKMYGGMDWVNGDSSWFDVHGTHTGACTRTRTRTGTNMDFSESACEKFVFTPTNIDAFTNHRPLPRIHEPNYGLLERVDIGRLGSGIPDYTVTCTVTETKSKGVLSAVGGFCIMISFAIVI